MGILKRFQRVSPLIRAIDSEDYETTKQLLAEGSPATTTDKNNVPAIVFAASRRLYKFVQLFIDNGASPNTVCEPSSNDAPRGPVLLIAARFGGLETVATLVEAKADVNATDETGLTALMGAAYMGHAHVVSYLIQNGATVDQKDEEGYTALTFAANGGQVVCCSQLLNAGADLNTEDNHRSIPIMFASQHGFDDVVKLLMFHGADPRTTGTHGLSAIDFAKQNGHSTTLTILEGSTQLRLVPKKEDSQPVQEPAQVIKALRGKVLSLSPHKIGLSQSDDSASVWGVLMETGYPEGLMTLVVLADGTTSLYLGHGGGIIGGGEHASVRKASRELLYNVGLYCGVLSPTKSFPYPNVGRVKFYVLTFTSTLTADANEDELGNGKHNLSNLFYASHAVISELRHIDEKRPKQAGPIVEANAK